MIVKSPFDSIEIRARLRAEIVHLRAELVDIRARFRAKLIEFGAEAVEFRAELDEPVSEHVEHSDDLPFGPSVHRERRLERDLVFEGGFVEVAAAAGTDGHRADVVVGAAVAVGA